MKMHWCPPRWYSNVNSILGASHNLSPKISTWNNIQKVMGITSGHGSLVLICRTPKKVIAWLEQEKEKNIKKNKKKICGLKCESDQSLYVNRRSFISPSPLRLKHANPIYLQRPNHRPTWSQATNPIVVSFLVLDQNRKRGKLHLFSASLF